jgi:hypothetical protein
VIDPTLLFSSSSSNSYWRMLKVRLLVAKELASEGWNGNTAASREYKRDRFGLCQARVVSL